jgi:hypothetical protein
MLSLGCSEKVVATPTVVPRQSAEEAILQVAKAYIVTAETRRLLEPPSAIAIHRRQIETRLDLAPETVEHQRTRDRLEYRDGHVVECTADTTRALEVHYRFATGQPMALVRAPEVPLVATCNGPVPVELPTTLPAVELSLVLRDETLVVVAPAADRRQFLPTD